MMTQKVGTSTKQYLFYSKYILYYQISQHLCVLVLRPLILIFSKFFYYILELQLRNFVSTTAFFQDGFSELSFLQISSQHMLVLIVIVESCSIFCTFILYLVSNLSFALISYD